MYSIQEFVLEIMKQKNITTKELAKRLGYSNITKGIRRINAFLQYDEYNATIIDNLHSALDVPKDVIAKKLEETRQQIEKERENNFKPFLYCVTTYQVPSPIFVCAITRSYELKKVELPHNFNDLTEEQKMLTIQQAIKEHNEKVYNKYGGIIPAYGAIHAYTLVYAYNANESDLPVYTPDGTLMENPPKEYQSIRLGVATVGFKGGRKNIAVLFKDKIRVEKN